MKHVLVALCCIIVSTVLSVIISLQFKPDTPEITISEDGFWVINGTVTDVSALGTKGPDGEKGETGSKGETGEKGETGDKGETGKDGIDGKSPTVEINEDGYWVINGIVTNVKATPDKPDESVGGLDFFLKDDESYAVAIGNAKYLSEIEIPAEYNNRKITSITASGFAESQIRSVHIPATVTSIEEGAFKKCNLLERVYIDNLASWCKIDFGGSDGSSNPLHCAKKLYVNGTLTENIKIPEGTEKISPMAFFNFLGIKNLTISDSVTEIGTGAFYGCEKLSSVTVGKGLNKIAENAFENCKSILEIYDFSQALQFTKRANTEGYIAYYALDIYESISTPSKLLYQGDFIFRKSAEENLLAAYLGDSTDIKLPESCEGEIYKIRDKLFYQNTTVKSVTISSAVTSIGASCFGGCSSLEYVIIGVGVTNIGNSAFPTSLEKFYYESTESEWAKIQFEDGNDMVKFLTKYYSSTQPAENAEKYWYYSENKPTLWN